MGRILLLAAAAWSVAAQDTINFASVGGRVTDPSGGVVQAARVRARHIETNQERSAVTDADGRFRLTYLKVGLYEIAVSAPGFAETSRPLTLTGGAAFELPITLAVGGAETRLTVTGNSTVLEAARSQIAGTVIEAEARSLPLNGRNFLDLALLVPGVSPTNFASTQLFPETSAVPGQGISVSSQRNFSNSFIVDGLSANDDAAGLGGIVYGVDTVHEFQVVTSGGQAELGRALGGYISVVTKSGTNSLHGDLYGYFRNQRLNATNGLSRTKLPSTQAQYGASAGGPLVRDRTFYFGNFEQRLLNQSGLVTILPANAEAINARLSAVGYQGPPVATGLYPNPVHTTNLLAKADHRFLPRDQFSARYSYYGVNAVNSRGAGALSAPSASTGLTNGDHAFALGNVLTLSERTVLETRGQYTCSDLKALPSDPVGPAVSIAGVATFGTSSGSPQGRFNRMYEVVNNLSHHAGPHAFRVGANFLHNASRITYPRAARGCYAFASMAAFLSGVYNNAGFSQTFGAITVEQSNPNAGFYAQDEWKVSPKLTLNGGVRYDLQFLDTLSTDRNNVSPRAGFAWSPFASRRTVIRGSAGLFYDRILLRSLANGILSAGNTTDLINLAQIGVSLAPTQAGAPVFPRILPAFVPTVTLVNLTTMDRNIRNAHSVQTSIEFEQQLGARSALSIGYQRLRGLHLILSVNRNVPSCVAAGNNNGCRPNPNFANHSQYSSAADSVYDGMHISFVQRPSRFGQVRLSYTYSKSSNNVGETFFSSPINPFNVWDDWGRSDDDQRHRLVVQGAVHSSMAPAISTWQKLAHGFQLSGMLQYYSALPFNITAGTTTIQGTAARLVVNGRFIERNAGQGFDFSVLNLRLSRTFRLSEQLQTEAMIESFNSLNRFNGLTRNTTFGTGAYPSNPAPAFGQVLSVQDPRSLQLALRFRF